MFVYAVYRMCSFTPISLFLNMWTKKKVLEQFVGMKTHVGDSSAVVFEALFLLRLIVRSLKPTMHRRESATRFASLKLALIFSLTEVFCNRFWVTKQCLYIILLPTVCMHISTFPDMSHLLIFAAFASPLALDFNAVPCVRACQMGFFDRCRRPVS